MAIGNIKEKTTLRLELDGGIVEGKQKIVPKSFSQIKTSASDEELYNTATAIASLQKRDLILVKKVEVSALLEE
ncbi:MAG: DUF1659 domain-containing protein [Tissierellia bacterium]|nr:DUF1659 domain-containing protein [Tissierellia bacterium]